MAFVNRHLYIIILSYVILVITNTLAVVLPFFGMRPGDISDLYPNPLTPADFTFRIWGVVYISLGVAVYYLYQKYKDSPPQKTKGELEALQGLFPLTCVLNIAWLIAWQSQHIILSFILIFIFWISMILMRYRLSHYDNIRWVIKIPISLYLGWICVAALANLNVMLIKINFNFFGLSPDEWTAVLIGIGILGTLFVLALYQDIVFALVLLWAFLGMYVVNQQSNDLHYTPIVLVAAMIIISLSILLVLFIKKSKNKNLVGPIT